MSLNEQSQDWNCSSTACGASIGTIERRPPVGHPDLHGRKVITPPLKETEPVAFDEPAFGRRRTLLQLAGRGITSQAYFELLDLFLAETIGPQQFAVVQDAGRKSRSRSPAIGFRTRRVSKDAPSRLCPRDGRSDPFNWVVPLVSLNGSSTQRGARYLSARWSEEKFQHTLTSNRFAVVPRGLEAPAASGCDGIARE